MKQNLKTIALIFFIMISLLKLHAQNANTSLSNLIAPTKVNVSLLPSRDSLMNLGSAARNWKNIYLKGKIYIEDTPMIFSLSNSDFFAGPNAGVKLKSLYGQENTGIGTNALYYGGAQNTAVGWKSMQSDSIGENNSALGGLSLANNVDGNFNVAVGWAAQYWNVNGNYNTSIGFSSGETNVSGNYNTSVGTQALQDNLSSNNTAVGDNAGVNNSRGNNNTYFGFHAGNTVVNGSSNTIIGYGADVGNDDLNNSTALGNLAVSNASNRVRIGNGSVTSIGGAVSWTNFSDERIKTNIKQDVPGLAFINLLNPVTYNFDLNKEELIFKRKDSADWKGKYDIQKIKFSGFLAQDVATAAKKLNYDFSGVDKPANDKDVYGLRYSDFVVPLVKAVQELSSQNDSLKNENADLKAAIESLKSEVANIKSMINANQSLNNSQQLKLTGALLTQNNPNPFSNSTIISYSIPQQFSSAKIIISDKNGNLLKQIMLSNNKSNVNIDVVGFTSGSYQYALIVDGRLIDTKQMEVIK